MKHLQRALYIALGFALPALAFAQTAPAGNTGTNNAELDFTRVNSLVNDLLTFLDVTVVPVIFAIAFLIFIWGVFQYFIAGAASEEKRDQGKQFVMWGLIGFVVMVSVWGLVNLLANTLGFNRDTRPGLPTFGNQAEQRDTTPAPGT